MMLNYKYQQFREATEVYVAACNEAHIKLGGIHVDPAHYEDIFGELKGGYSEYIDGVPIIDGPSSGCCITCRKFYDMIKEQCAKPRPKPEKTDG